VRCFREGRITHSNLNYSELTIIPAGLGSFRAELYTNHLGGLTPGPVFKSPAHGRCGGEGIHLSFVFFIDQGMKSKILILALTLLSFAGAFAQTRLYFSRQTGEKSTYSGSDSKTTDKHEQGSVTISKTGPITYTLTPDEYSIGINQSKTWNGTVTPDPATAPPDGESAAAEISGTYTVTYSRPAGTGSGGTVVSTYNCNDSAIDDGCAYHGPSGGTHEIVSKTGDEKVQFTVYTIKVNLPDTICLTNNDDGTASAATGAVYLPTGGTFMWTSSSTDVMISDPTAANPTITLNDTNLLTATIEVKYIISGVSYTKTAFVKACRCSCKPITNGIKAGPFDITFNVNPESNTPDGSGMCEYKAANAAFTMSMVGVISKEAAITDANVSFRRNCETGALSEVSIGWEGEKDLGTLAYKNVELVNLKLKKIAVTVNTNGNVSGSVTINANLPQDKDLTINKGIIMLRKGVNGDITFTFSGGNNWNGTFDFSGVHDINIDIVKEDKNIAQLKGGNLAADGTFTGTISGLVGTSYKSNKFTLTVKQLTADIKIDWTDGFSIVSGSGELEVSNIKAVEGTITLALQYATGNWTATVGATNIKAFKMVLDELTLTAVFTSDLDLKEVSGKLKAKHTEFDAKIDIQNFLVKEGKLETFAGSGEVGYKGFKFNLISLAYTATPSSLVISAEVKLNLTGASASLSVDEFKIAEDGTITVKTIKGDFDKTPVSIKITATFNVNRFQGTFSGKFTSIGLDGSVDVGAEPTYNFGYFALNVHGDVPLGNTGLKLTTIGGQLGFNYALNFPPPPGGGGGSGNPQQGTYVLGLTIGVADVFNMCEVTANPVIQLGNANVTMSLTGTIKVLKNNTFFTGSANVTYYLPQNTMKGWVSSVIKVPGSGFVFSSNNLTVNFDIGGGKLVASGANMGGTMFNKINLTNGTINLNVDLSGATASLSGSLGGKADASIGYKLDYSGSIVNVGGDISITMNSDVSAAVNESGLSGSFTVDVKGEGNASYSMAVWPYWGGSTWITGNSNATVSVGGGSNVSISGNMEVQLPININTYIFSWDGKVSMPFALSL
jgi:hypothetical protein